MNLPRPSGGQEQKGKKKTARLCGYRFSETAHTVKEGDSIHSIAKQYGISTKELAIMNQSVIIETAKAHGYAFDDVIEYAKYLFPGEVLTVPAAK